MILVIKVGFVLLCLFAHLGRRRKYVKEERSEEVCLFVAVTGKFSSSVSVKPNSSPLPSFDLTFIAFPLLFLRFYLHPVLFWLHFQHIHSNLDLCGISSLGKTFFDPADKIATMNDSTSGGTSFIVCTTPLLCQFVKLEYFRNQISL